MTVSWHTSVLSAARRPAARPVRPIDRFVGRPRRSRGTSLPSPSATYTDQRVCRKAPFEAKRPGIYSAGDVGAVALREQLRTSHGQYRMPGFGDDDPGESHDSLTRRMGGPRTGNSNCCGTPMCRARGVQRCQTSRFSPSRRPSTHHTTAPSETVSHRVDGRRSAARATPRRKSDPMLTTTPRRCPTIRPPNTWVIMEGAGQVDVDDAPEELHGHISIVCRASELSGGWSMPALLTSTVGGGLDVRVGRFNRASNGNVAVETP